MARLTARILKLERLLPTGLEAELRALSDEEVARRIDALLGRASEEDVRAMAREYPYVFTPEVVAHWRELQGQTKGAEGVQHSVERNFAVA